MIAHSRALVCVSLSVFLVLKHVLLARMYLFGVGHLSRFQTPPAPLAARI